MSRRFNPYDPRYQDDSDYTTNANSYHDDLARKQKLIEELSKRIWEYDKELAKRFDEWDKNLEDFPEDVKKLLEKWLEDGTLDHIINDTIFKWKADTVIVNEIEVNPMHFGAVGDGKTDDTEIIQEVLNNYKNVAFTHDHKVETLVVEEGRNLMGRGSTLIGSQGKPILKVNGSHVKIDGLRFIGTWDNTYIIGESLIHAHGIDNGYLLPPTRLKDIQISNCYFEKAGFSAIYLEYVQDSFVSNNFMQYMGYVGVGVISGYNVTVQDNVIKDISPGARVGNNVNAYGIFFSNANNQDKIRYPRSEKCYALRNYVENSPWEGIDTHGGKDISFIGNYLVNVTSALIVVSVDDEYGTTTWACENVIVKDNKTFDSYYGYSMNDPGGSHYHKNILIEGNQIVRSGSESGSGAIQIRKVHNVQVINNQIDDGKYSGIRIRGNVHNAVITGNSIKDLHSNSSGNLVYATCIWIEEDYFDGVITGNTVKTLNRDIAPKVNQYGLRILGTLLNVKMTGGTNYFEECTLQPYFVSSEHTHFFTSPIIQFGRYQFIPEAETVSHTTTITLKKPYSSTSLYEVLSTITVDRGDNIIVENTTTGNDIVTFTIKTADGLPFKNTVLPVIISWQSVGV